MADQPGRQPFRFRLPWVISAAAQAPPPRAPAPAPEPQPSATSAPPLRPPFRPPGAAPPRPFIPRTESIPPSRVVSQPTSPTRPFQPPPPPPPQPAQVVSQPPSPARTTTAPPSRAGSQPSSPPKPTPRPSPPPPPSPARPVIATSPPPPTPESKTVSQPPQLPSPSKIAAQLKSQEIRSPTSVAIPRSQQSTPRSVPAIEKQAQSPPPLSLPPPALSQPEKERKTETVSIGASRPTLIDSEAKPVLREPLKPRVAPTEEKKEEPEQRVISELPSTNHRRSLPFQTPQADSSAIDGEKKILTGRRVVDPLIHKDRTPPSPPPTIISESQQKPTLPRDQERPTFQKNIKEDVSRLVHKFGVGHPKQHNHASEEENPVSVITLAGENRGATMQLGARDQFPRKEGPVHIHRGYKLNQDHYSDSMTTDGESSSKDKKKSKDQKGNNNREDTPKTSKSFVNSNVQGINNSIMFNSSYSEKSPGVHLTFSRSVGQGSEAATVETRRADFRAIEPQKLTYEPTVRRRCLRGLFSEPIESDPDNPSKPRRHGCRYNCSQEKKSEGN